MNQWEMQIEKENLHSTGLYLKKPVQIVSGKGALVYDAEGNEYIDCLGGHGTANVGHSNPYVVEAIKKQAEKLIVCPESYCNDARSELYEKLAEISPKGMAKSYLCNSGTEAVEASIKFSRLLTGRQGIIACMRGFHGRTYGALSATWEKKYREKFMPLVPGFSHVPYNNTEKLKETITKETAAFLVEPVLGEAGAIPAEKEFLKTARDMCTDRGAMLVLDEIQTGFCRTGKMFALEHYGIVPDMFCMAKSIAGGLPMGAVQFKGEVNIEITI